VLGRKDCQVANSRSTGPKLTETVQAITRNDQLPLTGGLQMLTTSNVGGWCAPVHQVRLLMELHLTATGYVLAICDHICHLTQMNTPRLNPSQTGRYSI